jgi:hypothetical protein
MTANAMTTTEIRYQINNQIVSLSAEHLQTVADFVAYLADRESQEATDELLNIPGFVESWQIAEAEIATGRYQNWRNIRRDV